jgi:hypothetical protein
MCTHRPACPAADAIDWWAARNIAGHLGQGWTLLCNGTLVFDDHGALLPDGRVAAIPDVPRAALPGLRNRRTFCCPADARSRA